MAHDALAAGHIGSGVDRLDQLGDVGRLVLEVAVHRHHDLAAGARDAGVHRRVLAEVALERDHPHATVARVQPRQQLIVRSVEPSSTKITSAVIEAPSTASAIPC